MMHRYLDMRYNKLENDYHNGCQYIFTFKDKGYMKIVICQGIHTYLLPKTREVVTIHPTTRYERCWFEYNIMSMKILLKPFRMPGVVERCEYILTLGFRLAELKHAPIELTYDTIKHDFLLNYVRPHYTDYIEQLDRVGISFNDTLI